MERTELVETLGKLHAQLSRTDQVDPATLESLRDLTAKLSQLLEQHQEASPVPATAEPVGRGLRDLLLEFEADHPQLSVTLGKVADALAAMGI
jgi:hypothetical protein